MPLPPHEIPGLRPTRHPGTPGLHGHRRHPEIIPPSPRDPGPVLLRRHPEPPHPAKPVPSRLAPRPGPAPGLAQRLHGWSHDRLFRAVHRNRLVYNACWEDPRLDRTLLGLEPTSRLVMITSAGCNALDYLLDDPAEIHAVDVNPRQNAVLDLKLRLLEHCGPEDLFRTFGEGRHPGIGRILDGLAGRLAPDTSRFWSERRHYLDGSHRRGSFYFHGSSGDVAWMMRTLVLQRRPTLWRHLGQLLDARTLEDQANAFREIEPLLWNRFARWLVRQPMTLSLLGVPRPQARLITEGHPGGVTEFIRDKVRHVATQVPMRDNYFWRVYVTGAYTPDCCPNYLKRPNFERLRMRAGRVKTHTCLLAEFLVRNPAPYSHYVLLDHQDWLAAHDPAALAEEWRLLLLNSRPGTRILFRSAAPTIDFLPAFVSERIRFKTDATEALHPLDRVGTYGSLHLAEVR